VAVRHDALETHRIMDVPPVSVGSVLRPMTADDDLRRDARRPLMIHGTDTGFLVAAELAEPADYIAARPTLAR
jgi:hypothetical protein